MTDRVVLRKRGDAHVWVADWTDPATGKRKQHTVESEDAGWARINAFRQEALIKADLLQRSGVKQPPKAVTQQLTLADAYAHSIMRRWQGTAGEDGVHYSWLKISEFFGPNTQLTAVSAIWFEQWREHMMFKEKLANPTVNKHCSVLRSMGTDAIQYGKLIDHPQWPGSLPVKRIEPRWLDLEEIQMLRNFFRIRAASSEENYHRDTSHMDMEDVFVVRLCQMTRSGETLRLTPRDFRGRDGNVVFRRTKKGKPRTVPIIGEAMEILHRRAEGKGLDDPLFTISSRSYTRNFREAAKALKLSGRVTGHISRATGATMATTQAVPLPTLMHMGGWTSLKSVQHYAHNDTQALEIMHRALKGIEGGQK